MLDVLGDESGYFVSGGAVRFDKQPKFRGTAGTRRTNAPGESDDGGRGGDCGAFHRYSELEVPVVGKIFGDGGEKQVSRLRSK